MIKDHEQNAVQTEQIKNNSDRIAWLEVHYSTFNAEMGAIKTDVSWLKIEISKLRDAIEAINNKIMWGFIATIVSTILAQIVLGFYK